MKQSQYALGFILRHGERADAVPEFAKSCEIFFDPPLTPTGLHQAQLAADTFRPFIMNGGIAKENIHIYSSPLVRCMQTAAQVIIGLGLEKTHKIRLDSMLIEEILQCHFPKDPLKEGLVVTKSHEYIKEKYLDGIDFVCEHVKPLSYPEFYSETSQRFADGFYTLLKRHEQEKNSLTILVSHGRGIEEFNRYFGQSTTELCKYCGISGVNKKTAEDQWKLFMCNNILL